MKLTSAAVTELKVEPGKSELIVFDEKLAGFGVRIRGDKKTWIVQYRQGRQQRRMTLGTVGVLNSEAARRNAKIKLGQVQQGQDPQADKRKARDASSERFAGLVEEYLGVLRRKLTDGKFRESSLDQVERHLNKYAKPLHPRSIHDIDRKAAQDMLDRVSENSGPVTSNRTRSSCLALFSWAITKGRTDRNPFVATVKHDEQSRERVLANNELREIWTSSSDDQYGTIVKLLMLTGQRRDEVGGMQSDEIDDTDALWTIPGERTKNRRSHAVPLSDLTRSIIREIPRREGRSFLFGEGQGSYSGWSRSKERLDARIVKARGEGASELKSWTLHDIRRTVVTRMNTLGVQPHVVEAVVNHVSGDAKRGVAGIYNRSQYDREKRQALDLWADHVISIVEGKSSNVIPMRGQANDQR